MENTKQDPRLPPGYSIKGESYVFMGEDHVAWSAVGLRKTFTHTGCRNKAQAIARCWEDYSKPDLDESPCEDLWVHQLRVWTFYEVFDRIDRAASSGRNDIRIERSSGEVVTGYINPKGGGFGGRCIGVRFIADDGTNRYKAVETEKLIDMNPRLFEGLPAAHKGPR